MAGINLLTVDFESTTLSQLDTIAETYDDKLVESCIQKLITSNQNNTPMCLKLLQLLLEKRKNCNKEINVVMSDFDRDYWMNAQESLKYGIVDNISATTGF